MPFSIFKSDKQKQDWQFVGQVQSDDLKKVVETTGKTTGEKVTAITKTDLGKVGHTQNKEVHFLDKQFLDTSVFGTDQIQTDSSSPYDPDSM